MAKAKIYYVMGVSGSGKTTIGELLAKKLAIPFYDGDDFHPEENVKKMAAGHPLNDEDRKSWLLRLNALSQENSENGAVIVCSALKQSYRNILQKGVEDKAVFLFLSGSFEKILDRMQKRKGHFMPPDLLKSQFETLEIPNDSLSVSIDQTPENILAEILQKLKNQP
ncbi:gluconokinase [Kriegella aquimaris]|uniref:Gluconokinase n=1 Tax=Kriegella aquimaris TaxID=192904 RepID=A0A1G9K5W0_9FLAO|nr:gluconokinase [Kriegella aquimaris]SDL44653.1 gluconokinase [Kriegella aquimaris]